MAGHVGLTPGERDEFARRVKLFRKKNLLTQSSLARLMKVTAQTVSNIEAGREGLSMRTMIRFREVEMARIKTGKGLRDVLRMPQ